MADQVEDELLIEDEAPVLEPADVEIEEAPKDEAKAEPEPKEPEVIDPEKGLAELKAKLDAAEAERERERRGRVEAERRAAQAQSATQDTELNLVESAIATTKTNLDRYEQDYAQALTDGDYGNAAKIQRALSTESARLMQLEGGLEQLKNRPKPQPVQEIPNDPVEMLAVQLDPASANWIRQHPQYARDQNLYAQMLAAHNLAVGRGQIAGTPGYFNAVEGLLGIAQPEEPPLPGERPIRQSPPASAPVSRGANGGGSRPNVVRLTPDEREVAHFNFPDLDPKEAEREYARQKVALQTEGKMQ